MKELINNKSFLLAAALIFIAAIFRILPHPPNFAPIAAIALFGGARIDKKYLAFIIPFAALIISDSFIGFYDGFWLVYLSFALIVGIGLLLRNTKSPLNIGLGALSGSISFFVITNFGVWALGTMYPKTIEGLAACYTAAIPFFQNSLYADLLFTAVMFGVYEFVKVKFPSFVKA